MANTIPVRTLAAMLTTELSSSNYLIWRNEAISMLTSHDLLSFVDGSSSPPPEFLTDEDGNCFPNPTYANWYAHDQCILKLMVTSLGKECTSHVTGCTSSRAVWVALETAFSYPSVVELRLLLNNKRLRKENDFLGGSGGGDRVVPLDDDTLTGILLQLSVKSLIRFGSVSKSWRSIISADHFRRLYNQRRMHEHSSLLLVTRKNPHPIITKETAELLIFDPVTKGSGEKMRTVSFAIADINNSEIVNCSNGLMLLRFQCDGDGYYVYNPATKQSKKLIFAYHEKFVHIVSLHLVFDPSKSPHYKIVCVRAEEEPPEQPRLQSYVIEVYSSESRKWRICVEPFTIRETMSFVDCVQCNRFVYLIDSTPGRYRRHSCVYCFDIDKNVSDLISFPGPELPRRRDYSRLLQESNGRLYYCAQFTRDSAAVWELEVNGDDPRQSTWLLNHGPAIPRLPYEKLLRFVEETSTVLLHVPEKIVAYNFVDGSCRELLDLERGACADVYQFGETLTLL